jgi:hypothetical protein
MIDAMSAREGIPTVPRSLPLGRAQVEETGGARIVSAPNTTKGKTMMTRLEGNRAHTNMPNQVAALFLVDRHLLGPSKVRRNPKALRNPIIPKARIANRIAGES